MLENEGMQERKVRAEHREVPSHSFFLHFQLLHRKMDRRALTVNSALPSKCAFV